MSTRPLPDEQLGLPVRPVDYLCLAVVAGAPGQGARWQLDRIDRIEIGRSEVDAGTRELRCLRLGCADPFMSTSHAVLERQGAHWTVADAGSRNGVLVNGARIDRAALLEGDVVELGRSFFVLLADRVGGRGDLTLARGAASPSGLATLDPDLEAALDDLARIAPSTLPVLIGGPTGAGKERVARMAHERSSRRGAFVAVNCSAIPAGLIESELFGHRRGAFSGAIADHRGMIAEADGGTLFLDEVGDLPPATQTALLRVLQDHVVRPVGASESRAVDFRVVAASHRSLPALVAAGGFREDLYGRLAGFELVLPALCDRRCDLGLLLGELGPPTLALSAAATRVLLRHAWPRNVRELAHVVERALALAGGGELGVAHLPPALHEVAMAPAPLEPSERRATLEELLTKHQGNVTKVAAELGRVRQQVQRWLRRYDLDPARFRK